MKKYTNITDQIVHFAVNSSLDSKSNFAAQILRLSVLDWTAVAIAGCNEPVSKLTRELERETGGSADSVVIGMTARLPARAAAFVNGVAGHALDYDDTHFESFGHPSAVVVPAALAVADKVKCAPEKFYEATLIGIEVAIRIGIWLGRKHYIQGFHVTPTAGAFGAAMAAARLLDLSISDAQNAIGITASRTGGIRAQFGTMGKPFHAGVGASSGVEAALLAKKGFMSASNALECPLGFGETHHSSFFEDAFVDLGKKFITESIRHKFHACCHGTHATIEALKALRKRVQFHPSDIKKIDIIINPSYLSICNIEKPETGLQAKFSIKLAAALAVYDYDTSDLNTFSDDICRNKSLNELYDVMSVVSDNEISETQTIVNLQLKTGKIIKNRHDLLQDLSFETKEKRLLSKIQSLIGASLAEHMWKEVGLGDELPSEWIKKNIG